MLAINVSPAPLPELIGEVSMMFGDMVAVESALWCGLVTSLGCIPSPQKVPEEASKDATKCSRCGSTVKVSDLSRSGTL